MKNKIFEKLKVALNIIMKFIKCRAKIIVAISLPVLLLLGYIIGMGVTSEDTFYKNLEIALKNGDEKELSSVIQYNGKHLKKEELAPLIKLYKEDDQKIAKTINDLKNNNTCDFELVENKGIIGKKYILKVKSYDLKINCNFDQAEFNILGKGKVQSGSTVEGVIPGIYQIDGEYNTSYGKVSNSKEIVITKDQEIEVDMPAIMLTVDSEFKDAKLFINGEDSKMKVKDASNIGPFPTDESVKLHLEMDTPWGVIKGEDQAVKEVPNITLGMKIETDELKNKLQSNVSKFYYSVFDALNNEKKDEILLVTDETKDKIYDILQRKYIFLKNKYTIQSIKIVEDKSEYTFKNNEYKATIVVKINYEVSKSFFGLDKQTNEKMFFTKMIYSGGEWKIADIDNFTL